VYGLGAAGTVGRYAPGARARRPMRHPDNGAQALTRATVGVAAARSAEEAARLVLQAVVDVTGAERARLRFVDLARGTFSGFVALSWPAVAPAMPLAEYRDRDRSGLPALERATLTGAIEHEQLARRADDVGETTALVSRVVVPVVRGETCIGLFELEADGDGSLDGPAIGSRLAPLASLAVQVYERRFLLRLMAESQQPLDYALHDEDFYEQLMTLIALASQVGFAVLHYVQDGELAAVASFGFDRTPSAGLNVESSAAWPLLEEINPTAPPLAGVPSPDGVGFDAVLRDEGVRSFVVLAVTTGGDQYGWLTLGSSVDYEFGPVEVAGFTSLATGVGIAIQNHRNVHAAALTTVSYAEIGLAITGVEVAQAARHEARGLIDDCLVATVILGQEVRKVAPARAGALLTRLDEIDETLQDLARVVDKIKAATRAPRRERSLVGLEDVWDQARNQLIGKIHQARLESCRYDGPNVPVFVAVDWFRQVFINLMLNSLDAFNGSSSNKRGRQIRLVVERPSERQRTYNLTYSDNAGGINPASLRHLDGSPIDLPPDQAIFEANVTSKPDGSGWGLVLVRRILEDHHGTINVVDYRSGLTYRVQIPKPSEREM
jgi:signal transduction histidine kinase